MYPPSYWQKQLGKWFGSKYLLKEFLGCGAYGAVFRADEMIAERVMQSVAIKIVIADMDNLDNQLAELQLSVRLRHPHLINGITCEQGEIFGDLCLGLVMELADDTLEGYFAKQSQGLSIETVTTITQHLAAGLSALHEDGITHRDLKPANVLLVKEQWKLGDFGIARSLQDKTSTYTNASQQIGTVAYMPPEAYSGRISPAWDVWALGVMIHQLLSGQHPFPTQFAPELMQMVLMEEPQIAPKLPVSLRDIVAGCLVKDPQQRWSTGQILEAFKPKPPVIQIPKPINSPSAKKHVVQHAMPAPKALTTITENLGNGVILELIQLPAGKYMMGAPDNDSSANDYEKPQHLVIVKAFAIGKYPITQAQYEVVMGNNPSGFKDNPNNPVERVTWYDANGFCQKLSQATGKKYRLPSESEWEYACRAGTNTRYYFGDNAAQLGDYAWFGDNSGEKQINFSVLRPQDNDWSICLLSKQLANNCQPHAVGEKKPNAWGLYDMHGNIYEWCEDRWHNKYNGAPADGSVWIEGEDDSCQVLRGGSWNNGSRYCRSSYRKWDNPSLSYLNYGFRVVVSP